MRAYKDHCGSENTLIIQVLYHPPGTPDTYVTSIKSIVGTLYKNNKYASKKLKGDNLMWVEEIVDSESYIKTIESLKDANIPYMVRKAKLDNACRIDIDVTNVPWNITD